VSSVPASRWRDLGAGLCVAGLLIPEAVAYAGLAHLPAVHALTATLTGLAIYAVFGGSRFAIVAPTSSTATLAAAAVLSVPAAAGALNPVAYTQAMLALVLLAGVVLMLLAWARQGQLSAFVSRPVLRGFAFALAITIVIKQLPDALGFVLPHVAGSDPLRVLLFALLHVQEWHPPAYSLPD
jgi:SulP family sulfate permease